MRGTFVFILSTLVKGTPFPSKRIVSGEESASLNRTIDPEYEPVTVGVNLIVSSMLDSIGIVVA
jgi:hypothetical protein